MRSVGCIGLVHRAWPVRRADPPSLHPPFPCDPHAIHPSGSRGASPPLSRPLRRFRPQGKWLHGAPRWAQQLQMQPADSPQPSIFTPLSFSAYSHCASCTLGAYGRGSLPLHNLVSDSANLHCVSHPLPRLSWDHRSTGQL